MAIVFAAGTSKPELFDEYVAVELELPDYIVEVEDVLGGTGRLFREVDPYGDVEFSAERVDELRRQVAHIAAAMRDSELPLPTAPEVIGLEANPQPCGQDGALRFLANLERLLANAAERGLNVFSLGD